MVSSAKLRGWLFGGAMGIALICAARGNGAPTTPAETTRPPWPTISPRDIKPGMTGYGLTVFSGVKPERFPVRVVGILPRHTHMMDIILVESDDPRLRHTGIVSGMSGSPIYLDGKLAGALSLGWSFSKDPLAGVTPIEYMIDAATLPLRGRDYNHISRPARSSVESPPLTSEVLPRAPNHMALPLLVSGLDEAGLGFVRESVRPFGLSVVQGGGGTVDAIAPRSFEPGSAIAVELVRGDITMQTIGTVTAIWGNKVLAFGHSMLNAGETYFPVSTAAITGFLPSMLSSFKFGHALHPVGVLLQDRTAGIVADTSLTPETMAVTFTIRTPGTHGTTGTTGTKSRVVRTEMARHRALTPALVGAIASKVVSVAAQDVAGAMVQIETTLKVTGFAPFKHTDTLWADEGLSGKMLANSTGARQLEALLENPFAPVSIESLDLSVDLLFKPQIADLVSLSLPSDELPAGDKVGLRVALRPYGQALTFLTLPIEIPRELAHQNVKIEVLAGAQAKPEIAPPNSLADFVENLRRSYSGRSLVVTLHSPDEGVSLRGQMLPSLPASVLATLRPAASSRRGEVSKRQFRSVHAVPWVMTGKQELTVTIAKPREDGRAKP